MTRYSVGFVGKETIAWKLVLGMMLAGLGTLPQSASAQAGEAATTPEPNLQEPAPSSEPASEEPVLRLELAPAGVDAMPSPARTVDGYTLEEMELRVKRARIGLLSTTGVFVTGMALLLAAQVRAPAAQDGPDPVLLASFGFLGAGMLGMIASGSMLGKRNRELRRLKPLDPRLRGPRIGLYSSTGVFVLGGILLGVSGATANTFTGEGAGLLWGGVAVASSGLLGMIVSGTVLGVRKRNLRLQEADYGRPHRVQWDLAQSRIVF